jgi:DNA excision repair protein ERCC-4
MYQRGGVFVITTRILIVDLLTNVASAKDIDGILVAHAETVTEQSTEAFILRIFRTQTQFSEGNGTHGFVKAFSDSASALMSGFAKVDKILKALHVRRLYLYPRFHATVADELERRPPNVDELHQELSPRMKEIQAAIVAAVQACIRELKNSTSLLEWNDADLSVENCVTSNFDRAISRQLEHDWHRIKPQTKQLVQDLRTLRNLFQYLIHYDCVSFWKLINSIKTMSAASRHPSMWLLTPAADLLFRKAKERIYTVIVPKPTKKVPKPVALLKPVLEENPKWRLLRKVLDEIQQDHEEKNKATDDDNEGSVNVLVMVKDERTLEALKSYLKEGKERTMTLRWLRYLEAYNDRSRSVTNSTGGTAAISEESRLLLEEEGRARRKLFGKDGPSNIENTATSSSPTKRQLNKVPDYMRKRRRIAAEKGRGDQTARDEDLARRAVLDEAVEEMEHDLDAQKDQDAVAGRDGTDEEESSDLDEYDAMFHVSEPQELRVMFRSYSNVVDDEATLLLEDLQPKYIVLFDSDVSFVRSIEIFSSLQDESSEPPRVFFMLFEASAEEKTFMNSLEREQNAFERLIQHKKTMPLPVNTLAGTQEMQQAMASGSGVSGTYSEGSLPLSVDTRTGRGKARQNIERREIAVDVREFRSALPSILHQGGMRLAPVTLIVGDFVLSNVHCVERKSISDLFGSFASGRLYTQAESMSKYYKCPCLLIEFDPSKSFCLQSPNELGVEIRTDSICSKLCLLTMHFPKLRILWSRSPHDTLRIFKALKANHEEPNVDRAMEIGRNGDSDDAALVTQGDDNNEHDEINEAARDMLLRLPGVNAHNARKIMQECDSIAELMEMSREELRKIAGPVTGQKLFTFFRQKMQAT